MNFQLLKAFSICDLYYSVTKFSNYYLKEVFHFHTTFFFLLNGLFRVYLISNIFQLKRKQVKSNKRLKFILKKIIFS